MDANDIRDKLKKQRKNWLRERDMHNNREEVEREIGFNPLPQEQKPQKGSVLNSELADRLFLKMSEKLEQKYQNGSNPKPYKQSAPTNDADFEETLHNQVMSNTCPICFELFLPPDNQPYIIFPCGHTFCKQCINSYAKQKNKCPFCRTQIKSMAPNISLQNLILSASEKKEEVIKRLRQKQEQMIKSNEFSSNSIQNVGQETINLNINPDKYMNDYRMYDIRCTVLEEEKFDYQTKLRNAKDQVQAKQLSLVTLKQEKDDCMERLRKVQKELELIQKFEEKEESDMQQIQGEVERLEQSLKFIDDSLIPLKAEKDKARLMIQTISPHLARELQ